jgi:hypothetical protein
MEPKGYTLKDILSFHFVSVQSAKMSIRNIALGVIYGNYFCGKIKIFNERTRVKPSATCGKGRRKTKYDKRVVIEKERTVYSLFVAHRRLF